MKNLFKTLLFVAAAATAFSGCTKDDASAPEGQDQTVTLSFSADNDTRTTLENNNIIWQAGDQAGVYITATTPTNNAAATIDVTTKLFSVPVLAYAAQDKLYAYYPYYSKNKETTPKVSLRIDPTQTVTAGTFDGSNNPLVSVPYTFTSGSAAATAEMPKLQFRQLGSIIEFHVYSAAYQAEKVSSISFTADKALAGNMMYDLTTVTGDNTLPAFRPTSDKTVSSILSAPISVGADKSAPAIYMVVAPETYSGTISVVTDQATYNFAVTNKLFSRATIKPIGLNLTADKRDEGLVQGFYRWTLAKDDIAKAISSISTGGTPAMRWNVAMEVASFASLNSNGGYQIGTSTAPANSFSLTTTKYTDKIASIIIGARTNQTATVSVSVNGTVVGEVQPISTEVKENLYTFTLPTPVTANEILIDFKPTGKAMYLYSVTLIPQGYQPQALATPVLVADPGNATAVTWTAIPGAMAYEYVINTDAPVQVDANTTSLDMLVIKGKEATAMDYAVKVRAVGDNVQSTSSAYSAPVTVNVPAKPTDVGATWTYIFSNQTTWPLNGTAQLSDGTTTLDWLMAGAKNSQWDSAGNGMWKLGTNTKPTDTTISTANYTGKVGSVIIGLRTNSKKFVDVSVEVNGQPFTCTGDAHFGDKTASMEGTLIFNIPTAVAGTITIKLTNPTGGFGLQSLQIN
ncbi:MAG: fimbrillin family protein [Alistipes sp.]